MKIAMITNEYPPSIGGVQTHVHELSKALVALGHEVHVVTRWKDKTTLQTEMQDGIHIHRIALSKSHWIYDWQLSRYLNRLDQKIQLDVLHVHGMRPLKACSRLETPLIFTNHTSSFLKRAKQDKIHLDKMAAQLEPANLVLAPSEELAEATRKCGYKGPVEFIANGVDTDKFSPGPSNLRDKLKIPRDAFVVVLARRLYEKNGVLFLAEAFGKLKNPNLYLLVAGAGTEQDAFERIILDSGAKERVYMLGGVANGDMPEVYRASDVSVLPSLMEATSIAGLEAMACGLPLIGTNVGGIPAILRHHDNGLLVEPRSPEQLAEAITSLTDNPATCTQMGRRSRERTIEEFSWKAIGTQTIAHYESILA
ncbi:glycosyltransferase family 4 protein [Marinobacter oulmenensis]|uniref:Glycosyltransferase involved in cell wall biosynthesis n=1 Tax=Marinobacter oulmenensis TaxID=643747 RepID=A0A840UHN5_9GAMM|nr:glycosyltransferase family 4 protein [Marinobacter oulmenensis]MBB5322241.1 glycosyltransferase involved in cell wall biosynthesis [Marinobacter oulmenensis]